MTRTTIVLPPEIKRQAKAEAQRLKISFADFVRHAIADKLPGGRKGSDRLKHRRQDPLFRLLDRLPPIEGTTATDLSADHDEYLYGAKSEFRGQ
jgi:hypothetical protein